MKKFISCALALSIILGVFTSNDVLATTLGSQPVGSDSEEQESGIFEAGISLGTLSRTDNSNTEHPAILALEARLAGHSGLYKDIAITTVENYVNIRTQPDAESEIVGKIYNNSGAYIDDTVENEDGTWYKIHSGSCKGYIKAKYFLTGSEAEDIASTVSTMYATINPETLRLREKPSLESETVSLLSAEEKYVVVGEKDDFIKLSIDDDLEGYVLKDYVELSIKFKEAISIEEEQAELARQAELERLRREAEEEARRESIEASKEASREAARKATSKKSSSSTKKSSSSTKKSTTASAGSSAGSVSSRRESLCNYACSFVGNLRYVYGGNSLKSGTDCSGFVHMIFAKYGISVARNSYDLRSSGERVSSSEMRPGDIVCYSGHVAIYIGDDTVVHCSSASSNPNTKYSTWNYRSVKCIVNPWGD